MKKKNKDRARQKALIRSRTNSPPLKKKERSKSDLLRLERWKYKQIINRKFTL